MGQSICLRYVLHFLIFLPALCEQYLVSCQQTVKQGAYETDSCAADDP